MGKRSADEGAGGSKGGRGGGRGSGGRGDKDSKRAKYSNSSHSNAQALPLGKQGILVTLDCGDAQKASKEAIMVFNEVYEQLAPAASAPPVEEEEEPEDRKKQRFKMYDTGLRNCMFIEMRVDKGQPGPCEVVLKVLRTAMETKQLKFRYCTRFLPCTHTCASNLETLRDFAEKTVPQLLDCTPTAKPETVAVLYDHRGVSLDRMTIINMFINHVPCPPHKVQLKGAAKTISVQIVRNSVGIAMLDDYWLLHRYNVKHICNPPEPTTEQVKAAAAKAAAAPAATEPETAAAAREDVPAAAAAKPETAAVKEDAASAATATKPEIAAVEADVPAAATGTVAEPSVPE